MMGRACLLFNLFGFAPATRSVGLVWIVLAQLVEPPYSGCDLKVSNVELAERTYPSKTPRSAAYFNPSITIFLHSFKRPAAWPYSCKLAS
jgi:hypothetical protein